jgi:hypothetical protein
MISDRKSYQKIRSVSILTNIETQTETVDTTPRKLDSESQRSKSLLELEQQLEIFSKIKINDIQFKGPKLVTPAREKKLRMESMVLDMQIMDEPKIS